MLKIQVDGSWVAMDPATVVRRMLDGRVDRSTPAMDLTRTDAPAPLERLLQQSHFEELGARVLQGLQAMYVPGSSGVEPEDLRARVEALCKWDWTDPIVRGRLLWTAGWLEELTGSFERALRYYDDFLQQGTRQTRLRLLAYNNRGVLRIRLGRADGVRDLGRAAICMDPDRPTPRSSRALPAACFNLLNLLNLAIQYETLGDEVETALVDFLVRLPKSIRQEWLGLDPKPKPDQDGSGAASASDGAPVPAEPPDADADPDDHSDADPDADGDDRADPNGDLRSRLGILRGRHYERFNKLRSRLAAAAMGIAPEADLDRGRFRELVASQLRLWSPRPEADVAGDAARRDPRQDPRHARHADYAEAASLLYARHIPSSLTGRDYTVVWAERLGQENLARSEQYMDDGEYDLARAALASALHALARSKGGRRLRLLRRQVKRQLRRADQRQAAKVQLDLHETCAILEREVAALCALTDLCQAQRESAGLMRRLERVKADLQRIWGADAVRLMDDLAQRVGRHLEKLETEDLAEKTREPRRRLHDAWPKEWAQAVPDAAYEALAECRLNDPDQRVEDWDLIRTQLDAHQGRYHLQRVIGSVAGPGGGDRAQTQRVLALALSLDPDLGAAVAPIFALLSLPAAAEMPEELDTIRTELLDTATRLLRTQPMGDGAWRPVVRRDLIRQACLLLGRLVRAFPGLGGRLVDLWSDLARGFGPALEEGRPEVVEEIDRMIDACLDACPPVGGRRSARSDPRNPLNVLRENCRKVALLGRGEQALNAKTPRPAEAVEYFTEALAQRLERPDHLARAAVGLYLGRLGLGWADPSDAQRRILDRLEDWAGKRPPDRCGQVRADDVMDEIRRIREALGLGDEPPAGPPPSPVPEDHRPAEPDRPAPGDIDPDDEQDHPKNDPGGAQRRPDNGQPDA